MILSQLLLGQQISADLTNRVNFIQISIPSDRDSAGEKAHYEDGTHVTSHLAGVSHRDSLQTGIHISGEIDDKDKNRT